MCHEFTPKVVFGYIIDITNSFSLWLMSFSNGDRDDVPNNNSALTLAIFKGAVGQPSLATSTMSNLAVGRKGDVFGLDQVATAA
jgi:hypothetical protein